MTLALQEKRIDGDANKSQQQDRSEIIAQVRDLHAPGYPSPQRFVSGTLDGPAELAQITFYAGER
jgi:hypothetical protein